MSIRRNLRIYWGIRLIKDIDNGTEKLYTMLNLVIDRYIEEVLYAL